MNKKAGSLQEWLIAVGLFIVIPSTVYLGCRLVSPKIDYKVYQQEKDDFFEGYSIKHEEQWEHRKSEWKKTDTYRDHEKKLCDRSVIKLIVAGLCSLVMYYLGSIFVFPIIGMSLVLTGLILTMMYSYSYYACAVYHNVGVIWLELLFIAMSLLIVLWYAYQCSEKTMVVNKRR